MKRFAIVAAVALAIFAFGSGCSKKTEDTNKVPAEVKKAEMMDSTRMDSAMMDTMQEKMHEMTDSAAHEH